MILSMIDYYIKNEQFYKLIFMIINFVMSMHNYVNQ